MRRQNGATSVVVRQFGQWGPVLTHTANKNRQLPVLASFVQLTTRPFFQQHVDYVRGATMKTSVMKGMVTGLALAAAMPMTAMAEMSGNIGYTSNYLWRGQTQTNDQSAISGGLDYSHSSGVYAGVWTSNANWAGATETSTTEMDLYLGYAGKAGEFTYDVGYISYGYPTAKSNDFSEVYLGGGYGPVSFKYSTDSANDTSYMELAASFDLSEKMGMGLHYGTWGNSATGTDYSVTLTSGDFSFGLSNFDGDTTYKPFVSYSQSFDF